ncbi:MAG: multidrug effflux MFS transporter [Acidimicrobiales bacterium]|nr:multidrug effflux MFS transporter [Acidimicrobiales bacterium]
MADASAAVPLPAGSGETTSAVAPDAGVSDGPSLRLVLALGAMIALGPLTIDLYLPGLPNIEADLNTTASAVQLTLTGTLIGLAIGQLVVGPVSDAYGRHKPLYFGTFIHVAASVVCGLAPNIAVLGGARVLQGVGAASTAVVTMAIVRDLYSGRAAALLLSQLMLVLGVAPVLAPTLGGVVLGLTSWRGLFVVLGLFALFLIALVKFEIQETLPPERRRPGSLSGIAHAYRGLMRDPVFVALTWVSGLSMAAMFAYVSGASFVMQDQFGLDEQQFGFVFGAGSVFLIGGTQLSGKLLNRWDMRQILFASLVGGSISTGVLLAVALADVGGLPALLGPLWITLAFTGTAMPNAPAIALTLHGEAAGSAAALVGAVRYAVGAVAAPIVGVLGNEAPAMTAVMFLGTVASLAVLVRGVPEGSGSFDAEHDPVDPEVAELDMEEATVEVTCTD